MSNTRNNYCNKIIYARSRARHVLQARERGRVNYDSRSQFAFGPGVFTGKIDGISTHAQTVKINDIVLNLHKSINNYTTSTKKY